jgi:hypothetical protein
MQREGGYHNNNAREPGRQGRFLPESRVKIWSLKLIGMQGFVE